MQEALDRAAAGFSAVKVKVGFGVADDIVVLRAIAAALRGSGVAMMIDANHAYGVADAIALGRAVADLELLWFEEPVAPEDRDGYAEVRRALTMPIAGGENEHTLYGFRDLLAARGVDIVAARPRVLRRLHGGEAHRRAGAGERPARQPARLGHRRRAGGLGAADRRAAGRASRAATRSSRCSSTTAPTTRSG